jgi:general secretion pathway protein G
VSRNSRQALYFALRGVRLRGAAAIPPIAGAAPLSMSPIQKLPQPCARDCARKPLAPGLEPGFTLIELIITVMVVSLIAMVAFPMAEVAVKRTKEQDLRIALREIRTGIDAYKQAVDDGRIVGKAQATGYPPSLMLLVDGVPDARSPPDKQAKIYLMRRLPRDPLATDPALSAEETWGKRAYASPPDEPAEGDDVYDVYSKSTGTGLNGVPYKQW